MVLLSRNAWLAGWLVSYRFVPAEGLRRYSTVPCRSHYVSGILMCTLGYRTSTLSNSEDKKKPEYYFNGSRNLFSYSGKRYFMVINGSNVDYSKLHCHSLIKWKVLPPSEEQKPLHFTTSLPLVRDLKACEITIALFIIAAISNCSQLTLVISFDNAPHHNYL